MKLLIVYGTTEGQTRKICEFLRDQAEQHGHQVVLHDSTRGELYPNGFHAVIVAASLHAEKYQDSVKHYVSTHHEELNKVPGSFVSVSLTAAGDDSEMWKEMDNITSTFLEETSWHPEYVEQVAGALRYTQYNFLKKFIMRMIAQRNGGDTDTRQDHEYTDWDQVKRIITKLEKAVGEEAAPV
jgi:menaquinone-dependent protoporphyrinogen oxidase